MFQLKIYVSGAAPTRGFIPIGIHVARAQTRSPHGARRRPLQPPRQTTGVKTSAETATRGPKSSVVSDLVTGHLEAWGDRGPGGHWAGGAAGGLLAARCGPSVPRLGCPTHEPLERGDTHRLPCAGRTARLQVPRPVSLASGRGAPAERGGLSGACHRTTSRTPSRGHPVLPPSWKQGRVKVLSQRRRAQACRGRVLKVTRDDVRQAAPHQCPVRPQERHGVLAWAQVLGGRAPLTWLLGLRSCYSNPRCLAWNPLESGRPRGRQGTSSAPAGLPL